MTHPANTYSLVGDIGGTNTRLALANGPSLVPGTVRRYANSDHNSLRDVIARYVRDEGDVDTKAACVAVAGPVEGNTATLTNLDWTIDTETLAAATRAEQVAILNDLQAQGYALGHVPADSVVPVLTGAPAAKDAPQLVVGIGTGFNAAPVFETPAGRYVAPSESGHADMPLRTADELQLGQAIADHPCAPSVEDALSGRALPNIYRALFPEAERLSGHDILDLAAAGDQAANDAVAVFVRMLGKVCGNLALITLPFGGITLVGGMARAMMPYLNSHGFADSFRAKGRFTTYMDRFSVSVGTDDYAALTGSAVFLNQG